MAQRTSGKLWTDDRLSDPHGQPDKAARVQAMFDAIAPTYERVNSILSAGRDRYWRRRAVQLAQTAETDHVLDIACGTGDFARAFAQARPQGIVACDFAAGMLALAALRGSGVDWCRCDALSLPFADEAFTVTSCAFGVRNFQSLRQGLGEMHRVLKPGGRAVILEFTMPRSGPLGRLYLIYFRRVLPRLATLISGDASGAYRYLPQSVASFVDADGMTSTLQDAGFARVEYWTLTIGIVTVFVAWKNG